MTEKAFHPGRVMLREIRGSTVLWNEILLEVEVAAPELQTHFAALLGLDPRSIAIVPDELTVPPLASFSSLIVSRPYKGQYKSMLTIYLNFVGQEQIDEVPVLGALAKRLGSTVLFSNDDPNPYTFNRVGPTGIVEEVSLDVDLYDECDAIYLVPSEKSAR